MDKGSMKYQYSYNTRRQLLISYAVNNRYYGNTDDRMNGHAFRCALYIK